MAKTPNPLQFFNDAYEARVKNFRDSGTTTTGVINDYNKAGTKSYMPTTPSPAFKKGGMVKKRKC